MNYEVPGERTHKLQHSEKSRHLFTLYQKVRDARENKEPLQNMTEVWDELKTHHPDDWLCALEIFELFYQQKNDPLYKEIKQFLDTKKSESDTFRKLIEDGYSALEE